MPGSDIGDKVHNFFEQGNFSKSKQPSHILCPYSNSITWKVNQSRDGIVPISNLKSFCVQSTEFEKGNGLLSSRVTLGTDQSLLGPDFVEKKHSKQQKFSLNGLVQDPQIFQTSYKETKFLREERALERSSLTSRNISFLEPQLGNDLEHSLGVIENSERSDNFESPVSFDFFGAQQQAMRNQQSSCPQPWLNNQPGVNDKQLRQQHLMYRQMQELKRQQQIQQLDQGARQQNHFSSISANAKQGSSDQLSSLVNGIPIHDASNYLWQGQKMGGDFRIPTTSQMLQSGSANWFACNGSPPMQGFPNGFMFPQEQSQVLRSMGFSAQQLDHSLYGAPVVTARGSLNHFSHIQGLSNNSMDTMTKGNVNQLDKPLAQTFNAFTNDQSAEFANQTGISDGFSISRQGFHEKNFFQDTPIQTLRRDMVHENFPEVNPLSRNLNVQERMGWEGSLQEKSPSQIGTSHGLLPLDRTEDKVMSDSDEGIWDNSFSRMGGRNAGSFLQGNQFEGTDSLNLFPSVQSGSWSALMQSAVAETSSSDTGLQEEWSGLSFQKTELSTENRVAALNDSSKERMSWVDHNLQTASSLPLNPFPMFNDSNIGQGGFGVPGFQQSSSHESFQQSPKEINKWLDRTPQQKPLADGTYHVQAPSHVNSLQESVWAQHFYEQSRITTQSMDRESNTQNMQGAWAHQPSIGSYNIHSQSVNKLNGWNINESFPLNKDGALENHDRGQSTQHTRASESCEDAQVDGDSDGQMRRNSDNSAALSFPVRLEQVKSGTNGSQIRAFPFASNFTALRDSSTSKANIEADQQVQHNHWHGFDKNAMFNTSIYRNGERVGKHHNQSSQSLDIQDSFSNVSHRNSDDTFDKDNENFCQKEIAESHMSGHIDQPIAGDAVRGNVRSIANDAYPSFIGNKKSASQVNHKSSGSQIFQYHPMGNLVFGLEPSDTKKHFSHSQSQMSTQELITQEQGYVGQSNLVGCVSNTCLDVEKRDQSGMEEMPSRIFHPRRDSVVSSSFDGSTNFSTQDKVAIMPSQNMLELLHKVDQCSPVTDVSPSDQYQLEVPEGTALDRSSMHLSHSQSSGSQGFGLRLGPPSQRVSSSNHVMSSQACSQTVELNSRNIDQEGNSLGTFTAGVSFPRNQPQQQHFLNDSGQVQSHATSLSFPSQDDVDGQSKVVSHRKQMRGSHDGLELLKGSFSVVDNRCLPSSLAPAGATGPIPSVPCSSSSAPQLMNANSSYVIGSDQHSFGSRLFVTSGTPHGRFSSMLESVRTNATSQQPFPGGLSGKVPTTIFQSMHPSANNLEVAASTSRNSDDQIMNRVRSSPPDLHQGSINSPKSINREGQPITESSLQEITHGRSKMAAEPSDFFQKRVNLPYQDLCRVMPSSEQPLNCHTETTSLQYTDNSNSELDYFDHSMKPPGGFHQNYSHQNYSLLNQVEALKAADADLSVRSGKRPRGADFAVNVQEPLVKAGQWFTHGPNKIVRDSAEDENRPSSQGVEFSLSDPQVLSFSSDRKEDRNAGASQLHARDASLNDIATPKRNDHLNQGRSMVGASTPSLRVIENFRINPQMAPSWFERYGTFKPEATLPMGNCMDVPRRDAKMAAQKFFSGNVQEVSQGQPSMGQTNTGAASQSGSICRNSVDMFQANEHLSSHFSLPPIVDPKLLVAITKKRKSTSSGLLPWHKEISHNSHRLRSISMAEVDWAQATNRLVEKVEDKAEMMEDGPVVPQPRRRLILTTQLMQQIFCSIPDVIICADASSEFESLAYFTARSSLGDACSLLSCLRSDHCGQCNSIDMISREVKASKRTGDQFFSTLVEDVCSKARKLESDLSRLDKSASILDIRVECQELEKVSVINRFARFYGRGNADEVQGSSSGDVTQKSFPQRYVTCLLPPRNLPDGVPCLSL